MSDLNAGAVVLQEIVVMAREMTSRPHIVDTSPRLAAVAVLRDQLGQAAVNARGTSGSHIVDNFAAMLLAAIAGALRAREFGDHRAVAKWDSVIGHLVPFVSDDASALFDLMHKAEA